MKTLTSIEAAEEARDRGEATADQKRLLALPRWARIRLHVLEQNLASVRAQALQATDDPSLRPLGARTALVDYSQGPQGERGLPLEARVRYYFDDGQDYLEIARRPDHVEISGGLSSLLVAPRAANLVQVHLGE